ncbi:MAG: UDP-N-acetylmuramate dehydrogenase [Eubacteriales bacterium]|nr:UDP-N-acetylmuramate dehydrogenase [Eubacteriales bacterium]
MSKALEEFFRTILPEDHILMEEPMERHTTFRVGGPAACFITVDTREQLAKVFSYLQKTGWDFFVVGNGSNLLVSDKGYRGVIVRLGEDFKQIRVNQDRLIAGAGAILAAAAQAAQQEGLTGLEFAAGIPGTLGGAVRMNAGAYGGEMAQIVNSVEVMGMDGEILQLDRETMEFGYRTSAIKNRPYVVLSAEMKLKRGDREDIARLMQELAGKRREKQPLEYPSAGSTFKRPEGYFAGKLIMDAGLRGKSCGGAQISEKHCGFIINKGNATAADVARLIRETVETVQDKFGVTLEPEVIFLGDFSG